MHTHTYTHTHAHTHAHTQGPLSVQQPGDTTIDINAQSEAAEDWPDQTDDQAGSAEQGSAEQGPRLALPPRCVN